MGKEEIIEIHKNFSLDNSDTNFYSYPRNLVLIDIYKDGTDKKIIDLGCGQGIVGRYLLDKNYQVYGLELDPGSVNLARKKGLIVYEQDVQENFPFQDGFADEVFWGDNIEHVYSPAAVLKEIHRVLRPQGRLVISTVNYSNLIWRFKYLLTGKIPLSEGAGRNKNIGYWEHIRLWNEDDLVSFSENFGFKLIKIYGYNYFKIFPKFLYKYFPRYFSGVNVYEFIKSS